MFISAHQLSAQCCCGYLELDIQIPSQISMNRSLPTLEYFKVGYNYASVEKHQYSSPEDGFLKMNVDAGCGFESILVEIPFGGETMSISFTHVIGERIWNLGLLEWRAGTYEVYMPDLFDELDYYSSRAGQNFNGLKKYFYPANTSDRIDLFERGTVYFFQRLDSIAFRMLPEKYFKRELNKNRVCELELQQWRGPSYGWVRVRSYFFEGLQHGLNWQGNGKGRFRFVLIGKSESIEYSDFVLY